MEIKAPVTLHDYDRDYPGLLDFYSSLLGSFFGCCPREHGSVAERMSRAFEELGEGESRAALQSFQQAGLLNGQAMSSSEQAELFWRSPLMSVYNAAIGYAPARDTDLGEWIPEPVGTMLGLLKRHRQIGEHARAGGMVSGEWPYWKLALLGNAPELFLLPLMGGRGAGLDLGCGWGRASLGLLLTTHFKGRLSAVDTSDEQLELMSSLAKVAGCDERIELVQASATSLPFGSEHFDFALSYALFHLLGAADLEKTLREVLRCLKPFSAFHLEMPTYSHEGLTMVSQFTAQQFIERLHRVEAHGKVLQLVVHDSRISNLFTFAVLPQDCLPEERFGRVAHRLKTKAKKLVLGRIRER